MLQYEIITSELLQTALKAINEHARIHGFVVDVEENEDSVWSYSVYISMISSQRKLEYSQEVMDELLSESNILFYIQD